MAKPNSVLIEGPRIEILRGLINGAQRTMYARARPYESHYNVILKHLLSPNFRIMNRDQMRMLHYLLNYSEPNPAMVTTQSGRAVWRLHANEMLEWVAMSIEDTGSVHG